jgi:hypothetical protein
LVASPLWELCPDFCFPFFKVAVLSLWGVLSDERSGLSFVVLWIISRMLIVTVEILVDLKMLAKKEISVLNIFDSELPSA